MYNAWLQTLRDRVGALITAAAAHAEGEGAAPARRPASEVRRHFHDISTLRRELALDAAMKDDENDDTEIWALRAQVAGAEPTAADGEGDDEDQDDDAYSGLEDADARDAIESFKALGGTSSTRAIVSGKNRGLVFPVYHPPGGEHPMYTVGQLRVYLAAVV